jgi:hypothetical protein
MKSSLPIVFGFVPTFAFLLLLASFRSLVIAVKSVVLNLLSVAAAYGVVVQPPTPPQRDEAAGRLELVSAQLARMALTPRAPRRAGARAGTTSRLTAGRR